MALDLQGERVLVVGAGGGIGAATAKTFAGADARVSAAGRLGRKLDAIAAEVGGKAVAFDILDHVAIEAFFAGTAAFDHVVIAAAATKSGSVAGLSLERPQGPQGPDFALEHFRAAGPDLKVEIRKMVVADEYVTVHMEFRGHFGGSFGPTKGRGQAIDFVATDFIKVTNGGISDNWHIEDNLTLLSQMGVAQVEQ